MLFGFNDYSDNYRFLLTCIGAKAPYDFYQTVGISVNHFIDWAHFRRFRSIELGATDINKHLLNILGKFEFWHCFGDWCSGFAHIHQSVRLRQKRHYIRFIRQGHYWLSVRILENFTESIYKLLFKHRAIQWKNINSTTFDRSDRNLRNTGPRNIFQGRMSTIQSTPTITRTIRHHKVVNQA